MAINLRPLAPPLSQPMLDPNGIVTPPWGDFFNNVRRYQNPGWKDENIGGTSLAKGASNQPALVAIDSTGVLGYAFDGGGGTEQLHGSFELNHDYQEGSTLKPLVHWYPTTADAGNVQWSLEYWIAGHGVSYTDTLEIVTAANGVAWEKHDSDFGDIDGSAFPIGLQIHFKLFRDSGDATDTYAHDIVLGTFGIHYLSNNYGSNQVAVK